MSIDPYWSLPLVEPVHLPTVFFTGLCAPVRIGEHWRMTFFEIRPNADGDFERVAVIQAVATADNYRNSVLTALAPVHLGQIGHVPRH